MKSREIKKVSDVEILNKAIQVGNALADSSQKALSSRLINSIKQSGIEESVKYCHIEAIPLMDSLSQVYKAQIKRTSQKLRNLGNKPEDLENQLLMAYQYSFENNLPLKESVQMTEDGQSVIFTKPIILSNPVCLNCHGQVGKELSFENDQIIKSLYHADSATNYKMNDFRGMWSIKFDRKSIVNAL